MLLFYFIVNNLFRILKVFRWSTSRLI